MLSIQEILDKTTVQRKAISETLDKGYYHPEDASLYDGLKHADHREIKETMDSLSLAEILMKGQTTPGADKLVAAKLHDTLYYAAQQEDICPVIGYMAGPWEGANLTVNIAKDGSYVPHAFVSGAKIAEEEVEFVTPATLAPVGYGITIMCGEDLNEDTKDYGLIQWHVEQAAKAVGKQASNLALTVLVAQGDGDGTANTMAAGAGTTTYANILSAVTMNGNDEFISDTLVITPEAWRDAVGVAATGLPGVAAKVPIPPGFHLQVQQLNVLFRTDPILHAATDIQGAAFLACKTVVFSRQNALLTGRKRWLEVKNYADPIRDIAGAVVSYRQDSVTLYKDAICVLTET